MMSRFFACVAGCVAVGTLVLSSSCGLTSKPARPIGAVVEIRAPLGLPPVPIPANNPPTAETIALGRELFFDPILSLDRTISCALCHTRQTGFSDGKKVSTGMRSQTGRRNAPTILNAAFNSLQFWDGRAASLEAQSLEPVSNPVEMAHTLEGVERRLSDDVAYRALFEKAFGPGRITREKIGMAIAAYERTLISGNSPFDRYLYGGDKSALSASAARGLELFRDPKKANCVICHTIDQKYALFTDDKFHNLGVGVDSAGNLTDLGRYQVTKQDSDRGAFKTPNLRSVVLTAPYMHDGSLKTLKEVVDFYVGGGTSNAFLDKDIKPLDNLTAQDRADLVAFLESLTGELPPSR
ncbi:MAG TPA: cytochrome c peroxidase [Bryobacteraceae bacterium]|nr:cytochrome c peroxidase [Bryobacteraceae bacterium]